MELKTANEIRNDVAESYGAGNWVDLLNDFKNGNIPFKDMKQCVDEAMKLYALQVAEAACEEQRLKCSAIIKKATPNELLSGLLNAKVANADLPDIDKLLK